MHALLGLSHCLELMPVEGEWDVSQRGRSIGGPGGVRGVDRWRRGDGASPQGPAGSFITPCAAPILYFSQQVSVGKTSIKHSADTCGDCVILSLSLSLSSDTQNLSFLIIPLWLIPLLPLSPFIYFYYIEPFLYKSCPTLSVPCTSTHTHTHTPAFIQTHTHILRALHPSK